MVVASSNVLNHFIAGGEEGGDPSREDAFPRPTTFYATTKQAVENLGLNYAQWFELEFAALRFGAVFGPWSGLGGGGPSNVIREAVQRALVGEEAVLPAGSMEWVYSKDAARAAVLALETRSLPKRVFNITMGVVATPDALADALRSVIPGAKIRIETPVTAAVALPDMTRQSDLGQAMSVLGYAPRFGLLEALRDFAEWMIERQRRTLPTLAHPNL